MGSLISSPTGNGPRSILESPQPDPLEGNESACAEPEPDVFLFFFPNYTGRNYDSTLRVLMRLFGSGPAVC